MKHEVLNQGFNELAPINHETTAFFENHDWKRQPSDPITFFDEVMDK